MLPVMTSPYLFLFIAFGIFGAQSTFVNILGHDHAMTESKRYWIESPSYIEYTGPILDVKVIINGSGYSLGSHLDVSKAHPDPKYKPNIKHNFVDKFGNILECKNGEIVFMLNRTSQRYPVSTKDSNFAFQCHGDYRRSRVFIISGNAKNATEGKLYVLDTKEIDIVDDVVTTHKIDEVDYNFTAVTVQPSTGIILLTKEGEHTYDLKYFNITVLTPVTDSAEKQLRNIKLTKEQERKSNEFIKAVAIAQDRLIILLEENSQNRTSQLIKDNMRLRRLSETLSERKRKPLSDIPGKGNTLAGPLDDKLKNAIQNLRLETVRIYNKNVNGIKTLEEVGEYARCRRQIKTVRRLVSYYFDKIKKHNETDTIVNVLKQGFKKRISILNQDYEINLGNTYNMKAPKEILTSTDSSVMLIIGEKGYSIGRNFGSIHLILYSYISSVEFNFTDQFGNTLECINGQLSFIDQTNCVFKKCAVLTGKSTFAIQCVLDYEQNRAFIISGSASNATMGKLYVFKTNDIIVENGKVLTTEIKEVGDNISAVGIQSSTGAILLTKELNTSRKEAFAMLILKPLAENVTGSTIKPSKQLLINTNYLDGDEFTYAVYSNLSEIYELHEQNWMGSAAQYMKEHSKLKAFLDGLVDTQLKNISTVILSGADVALASSYNDDLKNTILQMGITLIVLYNKHLLELDSKIQWKMKEGILCSQILEDIKQRGHDLLGPDPYLWGTPTPRPPLRFRPSFLYG